ncbi:Lrp/AsnC family transcriptional regulator [Mycolicibacterium baixiangningiae]|uniref:Lrp/AsnC family transcriptional regulator n=1 Tax=Mycolicibacterium baixiangningiae TaxID=2761578 RepID=UPI001E59EF0E|nr:Lrp/AsnC family transcriptional regulator [Mycolicibacterium baixiangningiae]
MPEIISIELSARGRDLLLMVVAHDWATLSGLVLSRLQLDGILRHRTSLVTEIHIEASDWRLDALNRSQSTRLAAAEASVTLATPNYHASDSQLVALLAADGRIGFADLARLTGRTPATVRRQVARLLATGAVRFRCEISQESSRWPICCTWFCRVDSRHLSETAHDLRSLPEIRGCFSTTGESNLMFIAWARSVTDLLRIEKEVTQRQPSLRVLDSAVALSTRKRIGWLLDDHGCAVGDVVTPEF